MKKCHECDKEVIPAKRHGGGILINEITGELRYLCAIHYPIAKANLEWDRNTVHSVLDDWIIAKWDERMDGDEEE